MDEDIDHIIRDWESHQDRRWYKLAHVCRRWRSLILASASYLRLSLLCTYRTPVAQMLAHSPPLPLIIDYFDDDDVTTEDEEGILLALQHRDRVRSIRLQMPVPSLQKPTMAMSDEFGILECLVITPPTREDTSLVLPKTFQAPHLRHLLLIFFAFPVDSLPLATLQAVNLVSLCLGDVLQPALFHPNDLLQALLHTPRLESLFIDFDSTHDFEWQLLHFSPIMTHITLPNLRNFAFGGTCAYLEVLLPPITTPLLETLRIEFFDQLPFSLPHLLQFLSTIEDLRFGRAALTFDERASVTVYLHAVARMALLSIEVRCIYLDWQVTSAAQIINALKTVFSSVEYLALEYTNNISMSPERTNEADRSQWRELLRLFSNLKVLHIPGALIHALSCSLESEDEDGESPMELLPELKELSYSGSRDSGDEFTRFIVSREDAGHPVVLVYH